MVDCLVGCLVGWFTLFSCRVRLLVGGTTYDTDALLLEYGVIFVGPSPRCSLLFCWHQRALMYICMLFARHNRVLRGGLARVCDIIQNR